MKATGTIAVIPARAGSRRVPGKNTRALCGVPAIAYTIEAARASAVFDRVIVSTDTEAIAEIAREYGAEAPYLRDPALADDQTPVSLVTVDALERLDPSATRFACVAQLMPNCPLRVAADVVSSFRRFQESAAASQISVARYGWQTPWWAMQQNGDGTLRPLFPEAATARSQDLPILVCPTGAIWWARVDVLRAARTFHVEGRTGWEIDPVHGLDIDTEDDWRLAEVLMERRLAVTAHAQ